MKSELTTEAMRDRIFTAISQVPCFRCRQRADFHPDDCHRYGCRNMFDREVDNVMEIIRTKVTTRCFRQLCASAVEKYGTNAQLCQIQEEAAELIAAISHYRRGRSGSREHLLEELADMTIMLEQARVIFGDDAIEQAATPKIERLRDLLSKEGENS